MSKRILIIGGGISGLAAAFRLQELFAEKLAITLLEEKSRLGGVIETRRQDGFILEAGPDSMVSAKPGAVELCRRLAIEDQIISTNEKFRQSFLYQGGRLLPVPKGFYLIAPAKLSALWDAPQLSLQGKFRAACDLVIPKRRGGGDESIGSFIRRRLGQEVYEKIGQPMMGGIYSGDPDKVSLQATMPQFVRMEQVHGSVIRGLLNQHQLTAGKSASGPRYSFFLSLKNGLETLPASLERSLHSVKIEKNCKVRGLTRKKDAVWSVTTDKGEFEAEAVLLALPSFRAAPLVEEEAGDLAHELEKITYESVATINMIFHKKDFPGSLEGFGYIAAAREGTKLSACTFSSVKYAGRTPEGFVLLRAFAGGAFYREVFEMDDETLGKAAVAEVSKILKIHAAPRQVLIRRYPNAMPQYHVGHLDLVSKIREILPGYPGLYLCGNAYEGIGIPDCITQAERSAEAIGVYLRVAEGDSG